MKRGYELTYEWVVKLLAGLDFEDASRRLSVPRDGSGALSVGFLGREYSITKDGVELAGESLRWSVTAEGFDFNLRSVLGYYALSEADCEPGDDFCPIGHFSHGVFDQNAWASPLSKAYGNDFEKFLAVTGALGMTRSERFWSYRLLPKIPVKLAYYEGDDEFPTEIRVLLEKTAIKYFKFEPLAVLHRCFTLGLAALANAL